MTVAPPGVFGQIYAARNHQMRRALRVVLVLTVLFAPGRARAVLENGNQGPLLRAGAFNLRVSNAGVLGNPFIAQNLSGDPSFEYPKGSGQELLNYLGLWVGALDDNGQPSVSGGPLLEWRPTTSQSDTVREVWFGRPGSRFGFDDDGDGAVDEEALNDRDDDGDGETDEDLGVGAQQLLAADYTDVEPVVLPSAEPHRPLGLAVHQEVMAWSRPGFDRVAGLKYVITNRSGRTLRQVRIGLLADLDSRRISDRRGHLDDRARVVPFFTRVFEGVSKVIVEADTVVTQCYADLFGSGVAVFDGVPGSGLPVAALIGLGHTIDPLALLAETRPYARTDGHANFASYVFSNGSPRGQGAPPETDADRYDAMAGQFPQADRSRADDYLVLLSTGTFPFLGPGQALEVDAALVCAPNLDSLENSMALAAYAYNGVVLNLLPDSAFAGRYPTYHDAATGVAGHEACFEPPVGVSFYHDPDCASALPDTTGAIEVPVLYTHGQCVWTNLDCDFCTGINGAETRLHWLDPGPAPPAPAFTVTPEDHAVRVAWDNTPEILIKAGYVGSATSRFLGYRVWKVSDWRGRESLLPPQPNWTVLGNLRCDACDSAYGETPLSAVTDSSLDYASYLLGQKQYPPGRYAVTDHDVLNGFDYLYAVTTVYEYSARDFTGELHLIRLESPLAPVFGQTVTPRAEARDRAGAVWVVPNPYKGSSEWDRPPVLGDAFTKRVRFMGLPRAPTTIKIWTLAGDLVAEIDHDGSRGDGQASWDLISRSGQDVVSGIYLFTVDSRLGIQRGRFVVVR